MNSVDWTIDWEVRPLFYLDHTAWAYTLKFPKGFFPISLVRGEEPWARKWWVPFPFSSPPKRIVGVERFMGVDVGDIVEMDLELDTSDGFPLYRESLHKETLESYDAWGLFDVDWPSLEGVYVGLKGACTCHNDRLNRNWARLHWGLILHWREEKGRLPLGGGVCEG